jgi:putative DNA primase/helicase
MQVELRNIPRAMRELPHWVIWRNEPGSQGRATKVPYIVGSRRRASSTDPHTWATMDAAAEAMSDADGLGFCIQGSGVIFIDLDHCIDPATGEIAPWAKQIVSEIASYTEVSPSGQGLHIYTAGELPSGPRVKEIPFNARLEIYDSGRYSTVTGNHFSGSPTEILPCPRLREIYRQVFELEELIKAVDEPYDERSVDPALDENQIRCAAVPSTLDLQAWLEKFKIRILRRKPYLDGKLYVIECPGTHGQYQKDDGRAFAFQLRNGAISAGCHHESCSLSNHDNKNHWHDLRMLKEPGACAFSEDRLALRFTERHANDVRYVATWGKWMCFDQGRWVEDAILSVFDRCRVICREASETCIALNKEPLAKALMSAVTIAGVQRIATSDPRTATSVGQWDQDIWLLNTPGGAVDLRSGIMRAHRREDYCTKITAVAPATHGPLWLEFLARITDGDRELQTFLQRMVGYCLTGSTREECLFFLYGTGANGKSKFLNAVGGMLGDYAQAAPIATFIVHNNETHPTDLAGLRCARMVSAVETEEGRRWAESKIKSLTGGDPVAARFMRQDFFEFTPQFKLIIAGNHKPSLRSSNEAIRRRFHLVPFTVTIPPADRDLQLGEKLRGEWPGILQWAIEGALAWQRVGLNPPAAVTAATAAYLAGEDHVGRWMEEACQIGNRFYSKTPALYSDYCKWCERNNERPLSSKDFSSELEARGYRVEHSKYGNVRHGLALKIDTSQVVENTSGEGR